MKAKSWMQPLAGTLCLLLAGCAHYHPQPLAAAPDLARTPALTVPAKEFWLPGLAPHPLPKDGLDETTVITLAVFDDPDLKAARLQTGVARAQLLQAGLLPDPRIDAQYASSVQNYGGGLGLAEDLQALVTRASAQAQARAHQHEVNLEILWQEWQVAERARELFIAARADSQLESVLEHSHRVLADRCRRDQAAMRAGDLTTSNLSADLVLLSNVEAQLRQVQLNASLTRHQLNALLGLAPEVRLHLAGAAAGPPLTQTDFSSALAELPHRRADLLALRAGYASQEQAVRRAILAQFPSLSAGVEEERDPVEGVNSGALNVSLTLPLFNRNRGQIAIQRATRAALRQAWQARLDDAASQADQVWRATQILRRQLRELDARLPLLEQTAAGAEESYRENNLDASLYIAAVTTLLTNQADAIRLRASLDNAQSALDALLGLPFSPPTQK